MIKTEIVTLAGKQYVRTYSNVGRKLVCNGMVFDEAIDPIDSGRTYTEEGIDGTDPDLTAEEALSIITGGAV